jgi:RND family efflux transporter MFP subunit
MTEAQTTTGAPPARKGRRVVRMIVTLLVLGGGAAGFLWYQRAAKEKAETAKKAAEAKKQPQVTLVRVAKTRRARLARRERYVGELAALRTVELAPKVSGRIVRMTKELGDAVHKGEVVATIDDVDIVKQIDEAKAAVEVARAQIERAQAELDRAEQEVRRKKPLYEQQLVTRMEWENLESAVAVAKASLSLARAGLVQSQARVATLQVQLENTRVEAPFAGRVNRRYVDPGAMVGSLSQTPIYQLVTADRILTRFKVPERDLRELPKGKKVTVLVEAYPTEAFEGKVIRVSPAVDAQTRTALAEAMLSSQKGRLKPGMFARVDVHWSVEENVVLAPQRALVRPPDDPQGKVGVFLHEDGKARFAAVTPGREEGDELAVRGVPAGAELIVEGQHGLKSGALVKVAAPQGPPSGRPALASPPMKPAPPAARKPDGAPKG